MNWREVLICLFLFIAAFFLWKNLDTDDETVIETNTSSKELSGYYLHGTELVRFNEEGETLYTITAEKIEENQTDQSLKLSQLNIVYGANKNDQWQITADQATLPNNRKTINFRGNVIAKQLANSNKARFSSNRLDYDIDNETLSTPEFVTARQGIQRITATGMTLNIKTEQVKLHSNVKIRLQLP